MPTNCPFRSLPMRQFFALAVGAVSLALVSCGGGAQSSPPPPAAISVSVTSSSTNMQIAPGQTMLFSAAVQSTSNSAVTWQVDSIPGGNATVGTISGTGLYAAPSIVPVPNTVTITAVSVADSSKSASVVLTIVSSVTVSVSPSSASVQINESQQNSQQFVAKVTNATNIAVTWQVNGIVGGDGSGGVISSNGLYFPPTQLPSANPVTITAVSVADPTKSASASVTIIPPVRVSVSPISPIVPYGGTQQFTATVQNTSNVGVTWSVAESTPAGPVTAGTISSSGLYTAPANGTTMATVTVSATSVADSSQGGGVSAILTPGPGPKDSQLNGHYAFSMKGLLRDQSFQHPKTVIGSLIADGAGNLSGVADEIDFEAQAAPTPLHVTITGAYNVGSDGRGSFALAISTPSTLQVSIFRLALGTFVQGVATQARFIEFDSALPSAGTFSDTATGTLEKQDATAFSAAAIHGDFSFGFSADSAVVFAVVGRFHADGAGTLTAGALDNNELNGSVPLLLSNAPFTGSYAVDPTGRGTAVLAIPSVGTVTTVFYVVSSTELLFLGGAIPDNGSQLRLYHGVFSGPALQQTGEPFSNASLAGNSVFRLTGLTQQSGPELVAGEMTADGNGNFTGVSDQNLGGSVSLNAAISGTYAIASNGRGTLTSQGGESLVLYMVSPNKAFLLFPPPGDPQVGLLQPQTAGPFNDASISGSFTAGTLTSVEPPSREAATEDGILTLDGAGNATGTVDISSAFIFGPSQSFMTPDEPFQGTYSVSTNGRGMMTVTSLEGGTYVLYVISSTSFFTMYVGSLQVIGGFQPGLVLTQ